MARSHQPTGIEIAEQAKQTKFHQEKTVHATRAKDNLRVSFTPTLFGTPKKKNEVESGVVIGRGDVALGQFKTSLRPGTYHLFLAKVGDTWNGYAEFNGDIALEAKQVKVDEESSPRDISKSKPRIEFGSICFAFCIIVAIPVPFSPFEIPVPYCWEVCF
jgi:hypothetical protein